MKKYISPQVDFIMLGSQDIIRASLDCNEDNLPCDLKEICPEYTVCQTDTEVCPGGYGSECVNHGYNPGD